MIGTSACRLRRPASKVPVRSRHAPAACTAWCSTWLWQPRAGGGPPRAAEPCPHPAAQRLSKLAEELTRRPQPQAAAWRQHSPSAACSRPSQRHSSRWQARLPWTQHHLWGMPSRLLRLRQSGEQEPQMPGLQPIQACIARAAAWFRRPRREQEHAMKASASASEQPPRHSPALHERRGDRSSTACALQPRACASASRGRDGHWS